MWHFQFIKVTLFYLTIFPRYRLSSVKLIRFYHWIVNTQIHGGLLVATQKICFSIYNCQRDGRFQDTPGLETANCEVPSTNSVFYHFRNSKMSTSEKTKRSIFLEFYLFTLWNTENFEDTFFFFFQRSSVFGQQREDGRNLVMSWLSVFLMWLSFKFNIFWNLRHKSKHRKSFLCGH